MKKKKIFTVDRLLTILVILAGTFVIFFRTSTGYGESMLPTMSTSNFAVGAKLFTVERFDIVAIQVGHETPRKRIIGLPNETIEYRDNILYINNEVVDEPFLKEDFVNAAIEQYGYFTKDFGPITLGDDEYFYLGDNRPESGDARHFGNCTRKQIIMKTLFYINF